MSVVEEIKSRINIVDLIGRYTQLRRAGAIHKGLCPFHSERTPSFVVYEQSGTWHCFGSCATGGDAFSFLMKKEGLTFREALERLAQEAGVSLEDERPDPNRSLRDRLFKVNEAAAAYFRQVLKSDARAQPARDYLARRRIDEPTAEAFALGYSLDSWSGLRDHLLKLGFDTELQLAAGLIKRAQERESTYDAFRSRLIFPIRDRQGRVLGFGGRVLDDSQPKYLNTGDTAIFHKSQIIYGIDLAQQPIRSEDRVVIVEGYMDVIAAHQHGFRNVVASMGTALTADHLRQLQRLTANFVLALDADAAGESATMRALNQARLSLDRKARPTVIGGRLEMTERLNASLSIIQMPAGKDPDDVVRENPDLWRTLVLDALPLVDFYFGVVARTFDLKSAFGRGEAVNALESLIAEVENEVERQNYIHALSRMVQVDEAILLGRVNAAALQARNQRSRDESRPGLRRSAGAPRDEAHATFDDDAPPPDDWAETPSSGRESTQHALSHGGETDVSAHILSLLLREPDLLPWLTQQTEQLNLAPLSAEDMERTEDKELFRALRLFMTSDELWDFESFQDRLEPWLVGRLTTLSGFGAQLPARSNQELREGVFKDIVHLRLQRVKTECQTVRWLIDEAQRNNDANMVRELGRLYGRLQRELAHLQPLKHREQVNVLTRRRPLSATPG